MIVKGHGAGKYCVGSRLSGTGRLHGNRIERYTMVGTETIFDSQWPSTQASMQVLIRSASL